MPRMAGEMTEGSPILEGRKGRQMATLFSEAPRPWWGWLNWTPCQPLRSQAVCLLKPGLFGTEKPQWGFSTSRPGLLRALSSDSPLRSSSPHLGPFAVELMNWRLTPTPSKNNIDGQNYPAKQQLPRVQRHLGGRGHRVPHKGPGDEDPTSTALRPAAARTPPPLQSLRPPARSASLTWSRSSSHATVPVTRGPMLTYS